MRVALAVALLLGIFTVEALHQRKLERARRRVPTYDEYEALLAKMRGDFDAMARLIGEQLVPVIVKATVELRRFSEAWRSL